MSQRDAVLLQDLQELPQIKARHHDNGCALAQAHVQDHNQAVNMKQRQDGN